MQTFLTVPEYRKAPGGFPKRILDLIPLDELETLLEESAEVIRGYGAGALTPFVHIGGPNLGDPPAERVEIDLEAENPFAFRVLKRPVRYVYTIQMVEGYQAGSRWGPTVTPPNIDITPQTGWLEITSSGLLNAVFGFVLNAVNPYFLVEYTAGYDDGPVRDAEGNVLQPPQASADDGMILTYPDWVKTATRMVMREQVGEWVNEQRGLAGLQSIGGAGFHYARASRSGGGGAGSHAQGMAENGYTRAEKIVRQNLQNTNVSIGMAPG